MTTWGKCLQHIRQKIHIPNREKRPLNQQDYESKKKKNMMSQFTRGEIPTARKSGKYSDVLIIKEKQNKFFVLFSFQIDKD